jgi:hypothetical protein
MPTPKLESSSEAASRDRSMEMTRDEALLHAPAVLLLIDLDRDREDSAAMPSFLRDVASMSRWHGVDVEATMRLLLYTTGELRLSVTLEKVMLLSSR